VASSWILFFSYQDDTRSNTHQISKQLLQRGKIGPMEGSRRLYANKILFSLKIYFNNNNNNNNNNSKSTSVKVQRFYHGKQHYIYHVL